MPNESSMEYGGHYDSESKSAPVERIVMPHEVQAYRVVEHLREIFPMLYQSDQEVLARLCRQVPDLMCFCGCHISETDQ